tara:strand:- start:7691 stop:8005 length:315 start_codon:yes stop_codon:yes gene_type:complete
MSEILGHDVNGRPLRAGDKVVVLSPDKAPQLKGAVVTVLGPTTSSCLGDIVRGDVDIDVPHPNGGWFGATPHKNLRRIDDRTDHQPSEYTFDSLMDHLKSGAPA